MNLSKSKIVLLSIMIGVLAISALAFTPFTALTQTDPDEDEGETAPVPGFDHFQALADALDVSVEDLQAAYEAAFQQALEQSVNDALEQGLITQERADVILDGEEHMGRRRGFGMGMGGNLDDLVAGQLGITVEAFQAAQSEVHTAMIEQAVADGEMTQTAADLALARQAVRGYMEDAWSSAYQGAVQSALDAGDIDQAQADLLLSNMDSGLGGFGRMPMGGRGGHMRR